MMIRRVVVMIAIASLLPFSAFAQTAAEIQAQIDEQNAQITAINKEIAEFTKQLSDTTKQKNTLQNQMPAVAFACLRILQLHEGRLNLALPQKRSG